MTHFIPSPHIAKSLIAHWGGWGFVLAALARQVAHLIRRGDARGEAAAHELCELALAAHLTLMQEIVEFEEGDSPEAEHLTGIAKCLAILAFYVQSLLCRAQLSAAARNERADFVTMGNTRKPQHAAMTFRPLEPG